MAIDSAERIFVSVCVWMEYVARSYSKALLLKYRTRNMWTEFRLPAQYRCAACTSHVLHLSLCCIRLSLGYYGLCVCFLYALLVLCGLACTTFLLISAVKQRRLCASYICCEMEVQRFEHKVTVYCCCCWWLNCQRIINIWLFFSIRCSAVRCSHVFTNLTVFVRERFKTNIWKMINHLSGGNVIQFITKTTATMFFSNTTFCRHSLLL